MLTNHGERVPPYRITEEKTRYNLTHAYIKKQAPAGRDPHTKKIELY